MKKGNGGNERRRSGRRNEDMGIDQIHIEKIGGGQA